MKGITSQLMGIIIVGFISLVLVGALLPSITDDLASQTTGRTISTLSATDDVYINDSAGSNEAMIKFDFSGIDRGINNLNGFNVTSAELCLTNTTTISISPTIMAIRMANQTWTEAETAGSYNGMTEGANVNRSLSVSSASVRCIDIASLVGSDIGQNDNFSVRLDVTDYIMGTGATIVNGNSLHVGNSTNLSEAHLILWDSSEGTTAPTLAMTYTYTNPASVSTMATILTVIFLIVVVVILLGVAKVKIGS